MAVCSPCSGVVGYLVSLTIDYCYFKSRYGMEFTSNRFEFG